MNDISSRGGGIFRGTTAKPCSRICPPPVSGIGNSGYSSPARVPVVVPTVANHRTPRSIRSADSAIPDTGGGADGNARHNLVNSVFLAADVVATCKYTDSAHYPGGPGSLHHSPIPLSDGDALKSSISGRMLVPAG